MLNTTTSQIENDKYQYLEIVTGETIMGANVVRDMIAGFADFFGGRATNYESQLRVGKDAALREMNERAAAKGADAVLGIQLDYEVIGKSGTMLMVVATGTAVKMLS